MLDHQLMGSYRDEYPFLFPAKIPFATNRHPCISLVPAVASLSEV